MLVSKAAARRWTIIRLGDVGLGWAGQAHGKVGLRPELIAI